MPTLQEYISDLHSNIDRLRNKIDQMKLSREEIRSIDSIPKEYIGKAIPAREAVLLNFNIYVERLQGNISIPADGPFVATSIHFAYLPIVEFYITRDMYWETGGSNRWRRISSIEDALIASASKNTVDPASADFYWEYEVSEQHKKRQNMQVPSSIVHQTELGNGFFPLVPNDVFPKTSNIVIYVTSTQKITAATVHGSQYVAGDFYQYPGVMWCGFNGFYILEDY